MSSSASAPAAASTGPSVARPPPPLETHQRSVSRLSNDGASGSGVGSAGGDSNSRVVSTSSSSGGASWDDISPTNASMGGSSANFSTATHNNTRGFASSYRYEAANDTAERITEIPPDDGENGSRSRSASSVVGDPIASIAMETTTTTSTAAVVEGTAIMDVSASDAISQDERDNNDDQENPEGEDIEDDESDYSYDYEEDDGDDHQFTGFLVPSDHHHRTESGANVIDCRSEDNTETSAAAKAAPPAPEPVPEPPKRKSTWKEPSQQAVSMSLRAEKERTGGKRRLASDLYKVMMGDTTEQGFSMEPAEEDCMDRWTIKLFGFDPDSNLHKDMVALGLDHIQLEMSFPDQYPFEPPFVRVVRPRFKKQTGFVMNGALCMELLTNDGWNPINDIESVIVSIRSLLVVGDGRLAAAANMTTTVPAEGKKKKAAAVAAAGKKAAGEGEAMMLQDDDDDSGSRGSVGKRQKAHDGRAAAAAAADDDDDDDVDRMDYDNDDGEDSPRTKKKRSNAKISAAAIGSYSAAEAKQAYGHLSEYHQKKGWDSSGWWARKG